MTKLFLLPIFLVVSILSSAQAPTPSNTAKVAVTVTNMKGKAQKGEVVLFMDDQQSKTFSCRTDAAGKAFVSLPAGAVYTIKLKTLTDTSSYSTIDIPALQPGS